MPSVRIEVVCPGYVPAGISAGQESAVWLEVDRLAAHRSERDVRLPPSIDPDDRLRRDSCRRRTSPRICPACSSTAADSAGSRLVRTSMPDRRRTPPARRRLPVRLAVGNAEADRASAEIDDELMPDRARSDEVKRNDSQRRDRAELIEPLGGGIELSRESHVGRLRRIDDDVGLAELNLLSRPGPRVPSTGTKSMLGRARPYSPYEAELVERPAAADEEPDDRACPTGPAGAPPRQGPLEGDDAEQSDRQDSGSKICMLLPRKCSA